MVTHIFNTMPSGKTQDPWCDAEMADLGLKWVRFAPNGSYLGLFRSILNPKFAAIGAYLTNFGENLTSLVLRRIQQVLLSEEYHWQLWGSRPNMS